MKKILPLILVLLLSSCAKVEKMSFSEFRNKKLEIEAQITQISENYEQVYRVNFIGNGNVGEIEILEPESISGICAKIEDGKVKFNDTIVLMEEKLYLSPLASISHILKAWEGEPNEAGKIGENEELKFNDVISVFSPEKPPYSEIICDNKVVLRVDFIKSEVK